MGKSFKNFWSKLTGSCKKNKKQEPVKQDQPKIENEPKEEVAKPYVFHVTNDGDTPQDAVFYGYMRFIDQKDQNYGSGKDIKIVPAFDVPYLFHLINSAFAPFEFIAGRVISEDPKMLGGEIELKFENVNGREYTDIIPISAFKNSFQNLPDIVDFMYPIRIDHTNHFVVKVPPKSSFTLLIYPHKVCDLTRPFSGLSSAKEYETPILSGTIHLRKP